MGDRTDINDSHTGAHAGGSASKGWPTRVSRWIAQNPDDATVILTVIVVASLTVADIADWLKLSVDFVGQAAIAGLCLFTLASIKRRREQLRNNITQNTQIAHVLQALDRVEKQTLKLSGPDAVAEVPSSEIRMKLEALARGATLWYFKGGSGRWQRQSVLPTLSGESKREIPYRMLVLDPRDPELCGRYARYRAKQRPEDQRRLGEGRPETVRDDLLACIYAAGWYGHRTRVQTKVFLTATYSPFRYDMSDKELVITVANAKSAALCASAGSWFYDYVIDETEQAMQELPRVIIPDSASLYPEKPEQVSGAAIKAMLEACSVAHHRGDPEPLMAKWADVGEIDYQKLSELVFSGA